jgi:Tol biopolymer transport system component
VSPDGKWVLYVSSESGAQQVYVRSFPSADGGKWQVTSRGGMYPRWAPGGGELFYLSFDGKLTAVSIRGDKALTLGTAHELFSPRMLFGASYGAGRQQQYAVSPDGQRFLVNLAVGESSISPLTAVLDWRSLLER